MKTKLLLDRQSVLCHSIISFGLLLQERQKQFFSQLAPVCFWILLLLLQKHLWKGTMLLALKKCFIPFRAKISSLQTPLFPQQYWRLSIPYTSVMIIGICISLWCASAIDWNQDDSVHATICNPGHAFWTEEFQVSDRQMRSEKK